MKTQAVKPMKAVNPKKALGEYYEIVMTRYKMAIQVYEAQDKLTKEVIDRICDRLRIASTGVISVGGRPVKLEQEYIDFNILFIATEILADLALLDIQVANFEFHPAWCAECKKLIAKVPHDHKTERVIKAKKKIKR